MALSKSANSAIRHGRAAEREEILTLVKLVHGDTGGLDPTTCIVAVGNGNIVGCVRVKILADETRVLASLGVHPEYRRYGLGSKMLQKLLRDYPGRPLYVLCFPELEPFYRKNGFKKISGDTLPPILQTEYQKHGERTMEEVLCMIME